MSSLGTSRRRRWERWSAEAQRKAHAARSVYALLNERALVLRRRREESESGKEERQRAPPSLAPSL